GCEWFVRSASQRSGSSSATLAAGWVGSRPSTSRRYPNESIPCRWQEAITLNRTAAVCPPLSLPANSQFLRLCGAPHNRKNWLTVGSPRGGQAAAVLFSFTSTCQRLGVEPWAYLQDVLTRLPTTPAGQLGDLLPDHWQAAREAKMATPPAPASETPA